MIPIIVVVAVVMIVFYIGYSREKEVQNKYVEFLLSNSGKPSKRKITSEELAAAKLYCDCKGDSLIDDITWNDLNLNQIYQAMNFCQTSAGDEMLYYMLRTPKMNDNEWGELEKKIANIYDDRDLKRKLYKCLCKIGRSGKYCAYKYLDSINNIELWSDFADYLFLLLYIPAVGTCFFNGLVGAIFVFTIMAINIATYFKKRRTIESFLVCFQYVVRVIDSVNQFYDIEVDVLKEELKNLVERKKELAHFKRFSVIVLGNAGNSPIGVILDYLKMLTHVDLMLFKSMTADLKRNREAVISILDTIGKIDCIISIGEYRASLEKWCIPEFIDENIIDITNGYHPLVKKPVANSFLTSKSLLLTGSNASGKSTFLRMIAVNSLLAQTIHTALADKYVARYYKLYTSLSLKDNILAGDSYYMAEIKSIKRILDAADKYDNVLGFVDEVLRGTNTVERIAASTAILINMVKNGVLVFAATHDIELTYLLEEFDNYHFEEAIVDKDISFSYLLQQGRATTRNAILLLDNMGYDEKIINYSKEMVSHYEEKGSWI